MTIRHRPHRILFLPADDRPCSLTWPRLACRMVDWDLAMPPPNMLGWFNEAGKADDLATWAIDGAKEPLDGAVISIDMLAYGGSQSGRGPTTRTALAQQRLDSLAGLREALGAAPICGFSTILGFDVTPRSDDSARFGRQLREYSILAARADDPGGEGATERLRELEASLPPAVIGEYLAIRARNHEINRRALEELAGRNLDLLVLVQDTAGLEGLHREEQAELLSLARSLEVEDRVLLCNAGAEIGMLLIARLIHDHMGKVPTVSVVYHGGETCSQPAPGEDRSVAEQFATMTAIMGARIVSDPDADITALVNCPIDVGGGGLAVDTAYDERRSALAALVSRYQEATAGRGLAIFDLAFSDGADKALVEAMIAAVQSFPRLLAFSGWQGAGNALAVGLAHSALRIIALQDKGAFDLAQVIADLTPMRYLALLDALIESEKAHVSLLFMRLMEDYYYNTQVRPQIEEHIVNIVRDSLVDLSEVHDRAERLMRELLTAAAADLWIENFLGRPSVNIGMAPHRSQLVLAELEETRLSYPWRRLAEIDLGFTFGVELVAD
jgi:hypothetical protein